MKLSRREFFTKTLQGAAVLAVPAVLGSVLESCGKNNPTGPGGGSVSGMQTVNSNSANGIITLNIDSSSPLDKVGSAISLNYQNGTLLVDRPNQDSFNALSSVCTHQGCTITEFDAGSQVFTCPCHGSRFSTSGQVLSGPAQVALPKYQATFANNQLQIKV